MAAFLTTSQTTAAIEEIIDRATNEVVLISPYLNIPGRLMARLRSADRRGISIRVVCRSTQIEEGKTAALNEFKNVTLLVCDDLHAKCYYNEGELIITSLNLLDSSEQRNYEMGVRFSSDEQVYRDAVDEAKRILDDATEARHKVHTARIGGGHCIRCQRSIPENRWRPLCDTCYDVWAEYGDELHLERYCHSCGRPEPTSKAYPLCQKCFSSGRHAGVSSFWGG